MQPSLASLFSSIPDVSWTVSRKKEGQCRFWVNFGCAKTPGCMFVAFRVLVETHPRGFQISKLDPFFDWMRELSPDEIRRVPTCSSTARKLAVDHTLRATSHLSAKLGLRVGLPPELCRTATLVLSEHVHAIRTNVEEGHLKSEGLDEGEQLAPPPIRRCPNTIPS